MKKRQVELPAQTRGPGDDGSLCFRAETINEKKRTVEVVWTKGAAVRRYGERPDGSWGSWIEELSVEDGAIDLSRMNAGAPLLDVHGRYKLSDVIGVVVDGSARVKNGEGVATIRFSKRDDVEVVFQDVVDGVLRNVSVGYSIQKYEVFREEGEVPTFRAVSWTPSEVSLVPIGADPEAGVRSAKQSTPCEILENGECEMPKGKKSQDDAVRAAETNQGTHANSAPHVTAPEAQRAKTETPTTEVVDTEAVRAETMKAAAQTATEIRGLVSKAGLDGAVADDLIGRCVDVEAARAEVFDKMCARTQETEVRSGIVVGDSGDDPKTAMERMAEALAVRFNGQEPSEAARQYTSLTVGGMAEECLELQGVRGVRNERNKSAIIERALESSDFPLLLQSAGNRILLPSYAAAPATYEAIAKRMTASDFRARNLVRDGDFPSFLPLQENGEFKSGSLSESAESTQLKTVGVSLTLTRQALVNDDLGAFSNMAVKAGQASRRYENATVWGVVSQNKKLSSGKALYHADHGNLATANAAIGATSIGKGKTAIRTQESPDGNTLNYTPAILAVPAALETIAEQYLSQIVMPTKAADVVPASHKQLQLVVEPLLDAVSTAYWHLFVDPAQLASIVYTYLEGQEGPQLVEKEVSKALGLSWDVFLDFDAAAVDPRGTYRNAGA